MLKKRIKIIGLGLDPSLIPNNIIEEICRADYLVGGTRYLDLFNTFNGTKIPIKGDLSSILNNLKEICPNKSIIILTSGDPFFHGIAPRVIKEFGLENVEVIPNVTSMQYMFSKIGESWVNVPVISFHSSSDKGKYELLTHLSQGHTTLFLLTNPENNPKKIASILTKYGYGEALMIIGSDLGTDHEKIVAYEAQKISDSNLMFGNLNSIILKLNKTPGKKLTLGTKEDEFKHQNGLITKSEVRAITLSKLELCKQDILWDIGAGSGAISIEASLFVLPHNIYAIEKDPNRIQDIKENITNFLRAPINVIEGRAPECLNSLPSPTKIFIGGSDNNIKEILEISIQRISRPGIIVLNIVLLETLQNVLNFLNEKGCDYELVQVMISKSQNIGKKKYLKPLNPCWIIKIECI